MTNPEIHTDVLAALLRNGDTEAFRTLFDRFRTPVYAYCARMLGDRDEAEDATQETFILALRDASALSAPERFRGWLFGIARHRVMMMIRDRRNGKREELDEAGRDDETPHVAAERNEIRVHVRNAVAALPPGYREVVILRDFQHLSYAEIAIATGSTESAVRSRLHKARKALVTKLAPIFAEEDADALRRV
ncbi:MAG TPA: sigma-70 family RNA polymerase sigma factor [Bacteroidota bacterium]|nr:sigma-70 family RNA polymerase sigma factor [Bacteroidota bacterium]